MPISQADVKIILAARDQASPVVKEFGRNAEKALKQAETSAGRLNGVIATLKEQWLGMSAAVAATYLALKKAWNLAELAAQYEQSRQAFHSMVSGMGKDAATEFGKIKVLAAGLIDDKTLVEASNRAMSLGIPLEKIGDLMLIARAKARDMGITTTQAFNDIVTGIGRASPLILDNLGVILKVGSANKAMAESLGKTVAQLTDAEKKTAILNATIDAGKEALDRYDLSVKTSAERLQSMVVVMKEVQLIAGQAVLRGIVTLTGVWYGLGTASLYVSAGYWKIVQAYERMQAIFSFGNTSKMHKAMSEYAGANAATDAKMAAEYWEKTKDAFALAFSTQDEFEKVRAGTKPLPLGDRQPGGTEGKAGKTKSDTLTEQEKWILLAEDNLKRFQQVWDENEKWMQEHVWNEELGDYVKPAEYAQALQKMKAMREGAINARLAEIDLAEREGTVHRDTLEERIRLMTELVTIQEDFLEKLDKSEDPSAWYAQLGAINASKQSLIELNAELKKTTVFGALEQGMADLANSAQTYADMAYNAVGRLVDDLTDAFYDFVKTGKFNMQSFADFIIKELIRIQVQAAATSLFGSGGGLSSLVGAGVGLIGGLFGGGATTSGGIASNSGLTMRSSGAIVNAWHAGGLTTEPSFYRIGVNPRVFDTAPRYHSGIGPGEVAAVLRRDEGVFTPGQMRALGLMANKKNSVTVNVINNNGSKVTTREQQTAGGLQIDVLIDQVVAKKLGQAGSASNRVLASNFGTRESLISR